MKKLNSNIICVFLMIVFLGGCSAQKDDYYEIPKSEVVDVSARYNDNVITQDSKNNKNEKAASKYSLYTNERFGFSLDVPEYLKHAEEAQPSDEVYFESDNSEVTLYVYGSYYPCEYDYPYIDDIYTDELVEMQYTPKFTQKDERSFKISWEEADTVYWKKYYLKSDDSDNVLILSYPLSKKKEYEDDAKHILDSFKTGIGYDSVVEE